MVKKCCVPRCKGNYKSTGVNVSIYRFPNEKYFPEEREKWIRAIPRPRSDYKITNNMGVCRAHWPPDMETKQYRGKIVPVNPPSVFPNIPESCVPTPEPKPRPTVASSSSVRNTVPDDYEKFIEADTLVLSEIQQKYSDDAGLIIYRDGSDSETILQSKSHVEGVCNYMIKIRDDYKFQTFHKGLSCTIFNQQMNVKKCKYWSTLDAIISQLRSKSDEHKHSILLEHLSVMGKKTVGKPVYTPEMICRAFEYFCTSRALYNRLRNDYHLPSVRTLTRITSKVSHIDEVNFLKSVFDRLEDSQRRCAILIDEVYIKAALTYHGGALFGKAVDCPEKLATSVLCIMIKCLYGGPEYVSKALPVSNLTHQFIIDQVAPLINAVETENGKVIAILSDGHSTNRKCFKKLSSPSKSWLKNDSETFLLYDYVHAVKCIRNNWLTEKTGQIQFEWQGKCYVAQWEHLKYLQKVESTSIIKISKLNEVSVSPKPIERQKVSTCLNVFNEKTSAALQT